MGSMTINDILSKLKRWEEIPVNDICEAVRGSDVRREHLEKRLVEAGYFYAIAFDAFMPPGWVAQMRGGVESCAVCGRPNRDPRPWHVIEVVCPDCEDNPRGNSVIIECPQAEAVMRKHGYWEEGMK